MSELIENVGSVPVPGSQGSVSNASSGSSPDAPRFSTALAQSTAQMQSTDASADVAPSTLGADNDATEDRFLALLVAQMRNQDPMNPLENAEVTTQLAQINTVRGIEGLGDTLKQLLNKFDSNPVDAAGMLGRQVLVPSEAMTIGDDSGQPRIGGAYIPVSTGAVTAQVFGPDGKVVRSIELGPQSAGVATFEWDGKDDEGRVVGAGSYQLQVQGVGQDGVVDLTPLVGARVTGITRGDEAMSYKVEGGGTVPAEEILGIF